MVGRGELVTSNTGYSGNGAKKRKDLTFSFFLTVLALPECYRARILYNNMMFAWLINWKRQQKHPRERKYACFSGGFFLPERQFFLFFKFDLTPSKSPLNSDLFIVVIHFEYG